MRLKTFLQGHRSDIESAKTKRSSDPQLTIAGAVLVIPILAIFLPERRREAGKSGRSFWFPPTSDQDAARSLVADLNVMLQRYIRAKVILGLLSFLFSSVALLSLGFPSLACAR